MLKEAQFLIDLIATILYQKPEFQIPEDLDWKVFLYLVRHNKLSVFLYEYLEDNKEVPKEVLDFLRSKYKKSLRRSIMQQHYETQIFKRFEEEKIRYMPLKGMILRDFYPKNYMRKMTDMDILIDEENAKKAAKIMSDLGFSLYRSAEREDVYFLDKGITIELHKKLFVDEFDGYFDAGFEKAKPKADNPYAYELSSEDFYIYMIAHFVHHFMSQGVGIRAVIDVRVFLDKYRDLLDRTYVETELERMGIATFARQLESLAKVWFLKEDDKAYMKEFGLCILKNGYDGSKQHREVLSAARTSKNKAILSAIFPPYKEMKAYYPILHKVPVLMPICWVLRWGKVLVTRRKNVAKLRRMATMKESEVGAFDALCEKLEIKHLF